MPEKESGKKQGKGQQTATAASSVKEVHKTTNTHAFCNVLESHQEDISTPGVDCCYLAIHVIAGL